MEDPIIRSFLLSDNNDNNSNEENSNNGNQSKDAQQTTLNTDSEFDENMSVKLLEAAVLSSDDVLSEHAFNVFRRYSINHLPVRYDKEESNNKNSSVIFKVNHNGNGTQGNCLLTHIICNRHMNKILEKLQSMNKENHNDKGIQIRVGRFLEILRLCSLSHPKSTFANIWFLPWILEFINFDVTYVFFSKVFNYGENYQKWMNSNDFFISTLNAARELQVKLSGQISASSSNPNNENYTEASNLIDNQKLENLYLLITDFLSLQNFREKCQSPFRLSKMIKIPFHHTSLSSDFIESKDKIAQFKLSTIICFTKMLCKLYSPGSKKVFEDNLSEYVLVASAIMEIENKKSEIIPILTFDENFENVRISQIKVNLLDLISLIIDGINEKDEKRIEKIFSYILTAPNPNAAPSTSSVSPPPSFSSSSSFVSCSSQLFSFSSSASELVDSPPILNMIISLAEESLLRPRNEFELQKALKIITALIRKKFIGDDEVADFFFSSLLANFKREKRPIQRMALCVLASELPSLKNYMNETTIIQASENKNENDMDNSINQQISINIEIGDDFKKVGETDEINESVKIDEIEKIDGIEKVNEPDKISEIDEMVFIDSIVNDMSDSDCGDFISSMQDVIERDYGNE